MMSVGQCVQSCEFPVLLSDHVIDIDKYVETARMVNNLADIYTKQSNYESALAESYKVMSLLAKSRIGRPEIVKDIRLSAMHRIHTICNKLIETYKQSEQYMKCAEMHLLKAAVVSKKSYGDIELANGEIHKALKLFSRIMLESENSTDSYVQYYKILERCFMIRTVIKKRNKAAMACDSVGQLTSSFASLQLTSNSRGPFHKSLRNIAYCFVLAQQQFAQKLDKTFEILLREKKFAEIAVVCNAVLGAMQITIFPKWKSFLMDKRAEYTARACLGQEMRRG